MKIKHIVTLIITHIILKMNVELKIKEIVNFTTFNQLEIATPIDEDDINKIYDIIYNNIVSLDGNVRVFSYYALHYYVKNDHVNMMKFSYMTQFESYLVQIANYSIFDNKNKFGYLTRTLCEQDKPSCIMICDNAAKNGDVDAIFCMGVYYYELGMFSKMMDHYLRAISLGDNKSIRFLAIYYCHIGDYVKALELLLSACVDCCENSIMSAIGLCYEKMEKYELATDFYRLNFKIINKPQIELSNDNQYLQTAINHCKVGDYEKANHYFISACEDNDYDAMVAFAHYLHERKNYQGMMNFLMRAANGGNSNALVYMGSYYYSIKDVDNAFKYLKKAEKMDNDVAKVRLVKYYEECAYDCLKNEKHDYTNCGHVKDLFDMCSKCIEKGIGQGPRIVGKFFEKLGDNNQVFQGKSISAYDIMIKYYMYAIKFGDIKGLGYLRNYYWKNNEYIKTIACTKLMIKCGCKYEMTTLGEHYLEIGNNKKAEKCLMKSINLGETDALSILVNHYEHIGETEKMVTLLKYVAKKGEVKAIIMLFHYYSNVGDHKNVFKWLNDGVNRKDIYSTVCLIQYYEKFNDHDKAQQLADNLYEMGKKCDVEEMEDIFIKLALVDVRAVLKLCKHYYEQVMCDNLDDDDFQELSNLMIKYCEQAIELVKSSRAAYYLGDFYEYIDNDDELLQYYGMVVELNNDDKYYVLAVESLGSYYYEKDDMNMALKYFKLGDEKGHEMCTIKCAHICKYFGDIEGMTEYLKKAVNKGSVYAIWELIDYYEHVDYNETVKYYKMGVERDNVEFMYKFGEYYYDCKQHELAFEIWCKCVKIDTDNLGKIMEYVKMCGNVDYFLKLCMNMKNCNNCHVINVAHHFDRICVNNEMFLRLKECLNL